MARSRLTTITNDLVTDGGSILWSLVTGEQLEFPVVLNFLEDVSIKQSNNFIYEAVIIEGKNELDQEEKPSVIRENGVQTRLNVRLPIYLGNWQDTAAYNKEDVVFYDGYYWKLIKGVARVSSEPPSSDSYWTTTVLNKLYIQFPSTLGNTWTIKATVNMPVYGFFELRVTEPNDLIFTRTWKPIRGMVELLYSPTEAVSDV